MVLRFVLQNFQRPYDPLRIEVWSLIVTGDSIDRGVVKGGRFRALRRPRASHLRGRRCDRVSRARSISIERGRFRQFWRDVGRRPSDSGFAQGSEL